MSGAELATKIVDTAERNTRTILAVLVGVELVFGLVYSIHLGAELRFLDERDYFALAEALAVRHEFKVLDVVAFRPPFYPMFLAAGLLCGAGIVALRFANFVLLGLSTLLVYRITSAFARPACALLAAAWVLAYPVFGYTAGTLYAQTLAGFLLLAFTALLVRPQRWSFALAGLVFGILVLAVPSFAPLLGVAMAWLWLTGDRPAYGRLAELAAGAALPIACWMLRNHSIFGAWVFVATNSGFNLLLGNSEHTAPALGVNVDIQHYLDGTAGLDEVGRDRYLRDRAIEWISGHPGSAVKLYLGKFLHHFTMNDELATSSEGSRLRQLAATISFIPLQATLVLRLALARRFRLHRVEVLLLALYFANALFASVFFTRVRFRLPTDFLVLALLGGLASLAPMLRSASKRAPAAVARERD